MTNRFTAKAEQVLECANREARLLGHSYIGSEHILLGLSSVLDSVASKILSGRGVDSDGIKAMITSISGVGVPSCVGGADMTPRCKRIIERGAMEARKRSFAYIGTEHLLLAILEKRQGLYFSNQQIQFLSFTQPSNT